MVFWGIVRIASVVSVFLNPDSGVSMAAIVRGVDDIAMVNVLAYTGNSVSEKISLGYFKMRAAENSKDDDEEEEKTENSNG